MKQNMVVNLHPPPSSFKQQTKNNLKPKVREIKIHIKRQKHIKFNEKWFFSLFLSHFAQAKVFFLLSSSVHLLDVVVVRMGTNWEATKEVAVICYKVENRGFTFLGNLNLGLKIYEIESRKVAQHFTLLDISYFLMRHEKSVKLSESLEVNETISRCH